MVQDTRYWRVRLAYGDFRALYLRKPGGERFCNVESQRFDQIALAPRDNVLNDGDAIP